jgi:DNA-binding PadR family transcriptional regulator
MFMIWRLKKKPAHCYLLLNEIKDVGMVSVKPSTLYLILSKLEEAGLVRGELKEEAGRARRVYSATPKGIAVFERIKKDKVKGLLRGFIAELLS